MAKVENLCEEVDIMHITAVIPEVNMVGSNPKEWWIDTGTTRHICANRWMFKTYQKVDGEYYFMENSATSKVKVKEPLC